MESFDKIYAAEHAKAMRFARNHCNLRDDLADQIVADAFMDLHTALQNDTVIENLVAWLRGTIHRCYAKYLRHEGRVKRGGRLTKRQLLMADFGTDLAVKHHEFDTVDAIDATHFIWNHLTKMEQEIVKMVFMQELSQAQVAVKLGIALRTVERRINRIRKRLRVLLSPP